MFQYRSHRPRVASVSVLSCTRMRSVYPLMDGPCLSLKSDVVIKIIIIHLIYIFIAMKIAARFTEIYGCLGLDRMSPPRCI